MNKKEQSLFAHRCSMLLESGVSLGEALEIISRMQKSKRSAKVMDLIKKSVAKGIPLSKSLLAPKIKLDPTLLLMIQNGEGSGTLALSLQHAHTIMDKNDELWKKIISIVIYPAFVGLATAGMTLFLVMYIFPKILPLFSSMNITLPFLTRAVRYLYNFLFHNGIEVSLGLIAAYILFQILYKKVRFFKRLFQKLILHMPLMGECMQKYHLSGICRSASSLIENGRSLSSFLETTKNSVTYEPYRIAWNSCFLQVSKGVSFSASMQEYPKLFPVLLTDMVFIGERTGSLAVMLGHCARIYDQELDRFIKQFSTIIEPVLMICMGIVVGSVALSIILPIYEITNHLSH